MELYFMLEYEYNNGTANRRVWLCHAYDEMSAMHYAVENFLYNTPPRAGDICGAYIYAYNVDDDTEAAAIYDITETIEMLQGGR